MQCARDGSTMWWDRDDTPGPADAVASGQPVPVTVAVSPVRPGHSVVVDHRADGGPIAQCLAQPLPRSGNAAVRYFRALLPPRASGRVTYLPVLQLAGQPVTPRLAATADPPGYRVGAPRQRAAVPPAAAVTAPGRPRWHWTPEFLGGVTATLRKEVVGPTPDGLRIDWHVTSGHFSGPGLEATVLPGAADWMRIRADGVGIVSVQACFETTTGARIFASYSGYFDLGPDGYARALRDQFDPLPPVVLTPTYATADRALAWLNRLQCVGVGRIDMTALRVEFDVYRLQVGGRREST